MQKPYKYLMVFLSILLVWAQSTVAMHNHYQRNYNPNHLLNFYHSQLPQHDYQHQHSDDCVVCKVAEVGKDKINDAKIYNATHISKINTVFVCVKQNLLQITWVKPSSRAPPLF